MTDEAKTKLTLRYAIDDDAYEVVVPASGAEIGRAAECRLVIEDSEVSRHHARLSCEDGTWTISDMGSTNGTSVNGAKLDQPGELSDGDVVTVHTYDLLVSLEEDTGGGIVFDERDPDEAMGTFIASADVLKLRDPRSGQTTFWSSSAAPLKRCSAPSTSRPCSKRSCVWPSTTCRRSVAPSPCARARARARARAQSCDRW